MLPYYTARVHTLAARFSAAALCALLSTFALGQTTAQAPDRSAPAVQVPTEVLVAPRFVGAPQLVYPAEEIGKYGEGWVNLGLMVDPTGKPFEVTVNSSTGNKAFEKQAVDWMEHAVFKPGLLNGQPIESAREFKVTFVSNEPKTGARPEFTQRYRALQSAIKAKDRRAADDAMKRLDVNNLYEDAFFGLISYAYALEWGDETQQLAGLQRAVAHETGAHYLAERDFQSVQLQSLLLNVKLHHYVEAMTLWSYLLGSGVDPAVIEKIRPMMRQIDQVRLLGQAYDVAGSMPDGTWRLDLFVPNFRIRVGQGHVSQVKLRCAKGFVRFAFDPDIEYKVESKYGTCNMELDGDPGTAFTVTQF